LAVRARRDKIELPTLRAVHSQLTGRLFLARTYATAAGWSNRQCRCVMEVFDTVDEFITWIDLILSRLNGSDTYATDVWNEAWQQAAFNATHFGLSSEPDNLAHLRVYMLSPDSREAELIRNQLRARLSAIRVALSGQGGSPSKPIITGTLADETTAGVGRAESGCIMGGNKTAALKTIEKHGSAIADAIVSAWNLREWVREATRCRTLQPVLNSLLPGVRSRLELSLIDGGLSASVAALPSRDKLTAASLIAFVEQLELPSGMTLQIPPGEPPIKWDTLSRKRALRIAMQVCGQDYKPLFDADCEDDLNKIESMDGFLLAELWAAAVANESAYARADEAAAMQSHNPLREGDRHITSAALAISRQLFADRFRELADQFQAEKAATDAGQAVEGLSKQAIAAELFIEVVDRGYLTSVPGAHQLVRSYREAKARYDAGESVGFVEGRCVAYAVRPEATRVPCAENLFIDVAGDDRIEVYNDGGTIEPQRWLPPKGLLPDAVRGMFPARNWPLSQNRDDERHDFMRLARSGTADRYALACRLLAELLEQEQAAHSEGSSVDAASSSAVGRPKQYLRNWREILAALDLPNNEESKGWVRRLIDLHAGPIILPHKRGGQPKAEKSKLIEWWNGLEDRFKESGQRIRDRDATVAVTHNYGRDGTVAPDVGGSVKNRRTSQKVRKGPKTS
jgi:hypothetical protein